MPDFIMVLFYLQDIDLTWNTGSPDFTSCFQETVLVWAPAAWLWVTLIPYACYLNHVRGPALKRSKLFIAKLVSLYFISFVLLHPYISRNKEKYLLLL